MKLMKTIYNRNLLPADSYTVECGEHKKMFDKGEEKEVGKWVQKIWEESFFPEQHISTSI